MSSSVAVRRARPATASPAAPSVGFVSLGCPKALVDSELIVTQLAAEGYATSPTYEGADLVIVNTCGFIDSAVKESLDAIGEALAENGRVIVTGCLGARQESGENLVARVHPKVLAVTGPHAANEVLDHVHRHLPRPHDPYTDLVPPAGIKLTPRHYAYLKISEGCNHRCSFCIIPSMRGDLVSRPIGKVMREAEALVKQGVREILVISQDTSAYGVDVRYKLDFVGGRTVKTKMMDLVKELAQLGVWVRLHCVIRTHVDEVLPLMAEGKRAISRRPVPASHPRVLKAMETASFGRKTSSASAPGVRCVRTLTIRSTFIAGFPGETDTEFEHLLAFLREAELDRVGCFAYSPVEGAAANALEGQLSDDVRESRRARFMQVQEDISERRLQRKVGTTQRVILDEVGPTVAVGRSMADAPEIDGVVYVKTGRRKLAVGDFVDVKVASADRHDLHGSVA
jgi:ribosomal protein S12 methylthiotransferase